MKFFAPDNRAFLMVACISVVLFVLVFIFMFSDEDTESKKKSIMLNNIDGRAKTSNVDAQVSDLYKQSIQELNKENYEKASKSISGAAMPVLYHDKPDTKAASIEGCGCTFDATARDALIEELRKLGVTNINKSDGLRLGQSDVYVQTDGTIIDQTGAPYLWDGEEVRTSDTGVVLHSQSGMPIETSDGQSIHLSKEGKFYNDVTAIIRLMGRMLSSEGVILLGNGYKAHRPGGMSQVHDTDIYITTDRQLATIDAKPVFNGSSTVFKDMENRLHDYYGKNIKWEERSAFQQNDGKLTGRAGEKFSRIGVLISHGGILIDNDSMLTDELNDIKRFSDSDLYVNSQNMLVDSYGQEITYQNYNVKVGVNNILNSEIGPVVNSSGSQVSINNSGRFAADQPVFLTGTLKDSQNVAFDRFGHRISRQGKLLQLADSVVWHTADRYLATEDGQSLQFNGADVFQDIRRFKQINSLDAYGLKTNQDVVIRDLLGQEVYLNELGQLIYDNGQKITEAGILTTSEGVIITSNGELIVGSDGYNPVLSAAGEPIYYNGRKVYQGKDGRLYDSKGNLMLSPSGKSMTLLDDGLVVDEDGNVVDKVLSKLAPINANNGFHTGRNNLLLDKNGDQVYFNGKKIKRGDDGRLYDEDGELLTDKNGYPLSLNSDGQIVNSAGQFASMDGFAVDEKELIPLSKNEGFIVDKNNELRDEHGNQIYFNGKKVKLGSDGRLYDENGQLLTDMSGQPLSINPNGQIVTPNGLLASVEGFEVESDSLNAIHGNKGFKLGSNGELLDKNGGQVYYKGKKVNRGSDGRLYDENGELLRGENGQPLKLNEKWEIVTSNGELASMDGFETMGMQLKEVDQNKGLYRSSDGNLLDKNANEVYFKGKKVFVGEDGRLYDVNGTVLTNDDGETLKLSEDGVIVTPNGKEADLTDFQVERLSLMPITGNSGFSVDKNNALRDENGNQLYFNGKKVVRGDDGRLYDEDGELLTDKGGKPLSLNNKGQIVTPDGQLASVQGFAIEPNPLKPINGNKGFEVGRNGELLDSSGAQVYYKGKKVVRGDDGRLYDESGTLLKGMNGLPLALNSKGQIVTSSGQLAALDDFAVDSTSYIPVERNQGFKVGKNNTLLDEDGNQVYFKGKKVHRGSDGRLYDEDGDLLTDQSGQPLSLNSEGKIVTPNGNWASIDNFATKKGTFKSVGENKGLKKAWDGSLLDNNGNQVYFKGKKVFVGDDGRLYDAKGLLLTNEGGETLKLNADGVIVTPNGRKAAVTDFQVEDLSLIPITGNAGFSVDENNALRDENGNQVYFKGKKVTRGVDGRLYDEDGELLTDKNGKPLSLNSKGQIVTSDGQLASIESFTVEDLKFTPLKQNKGFKTGKNNELLDEHGNQVYFKGKKVTRGVDGRLYDEDGELLTDKNGKPLLLNSKGQIVTPEGQLASVNDFSVKDGLKKSGLNKVTANKGFHIGNGNSLLDENGNQVYFKGKKVTRGADGRLYDEDGELLTDKYGEPLSLDDKGQIVTPDGRLASLDGLEFESKLGRELLKATSDNQLMKLGENGAFSTEDGLLVDKNGKSITYKGKRLRRGKNGQLFDENGNAVLDQNGNPIHMNDQGTIVDVNGNPIEGVLLQNGDGQYLHEGAEGPAIRRIGDSDIYMTREGLLTDDQGKPITFNGKPVKIGEGGRLYTTDGVAVTDAEGNVVALTNTGELKNRSGMPAKGAVLQDGEGVSLDPQGLRVTNGGKLTSLGNGLYKTAGGLLVDRLGKPVLIEGKQAFVNDSNEIVDAHGYPLRYQGRRLNLTNTGALIDAQGNPVIEDGQAVILTSKGFTKEDGTLIELPETVVPKERDANSKLKEFISEQKQTIDEPNTNGPHNDIPSQADAEPNDTEGDPEVDIAKILDVSTLTDKEIIRLNRRYAAIYQSMEQKLSEYDGDFKAKPTSSVATFSQPTSKDTLDNSGPSSTSPNQNRVNGNVINNDIEPYIANEDLMKLQSGTVLYGANQMTVNTDLDSRVVFNLMGLPHTHPLYRGTAQGVVTLKYDHIVIAVTSLCPEKSECYPVQALAVDPTTRSASVNGDIDKHYWYRFGGLTLATLVQGAAIAVGESRDRTDTYDEEGKVVSYSGLDGKELMIRATEPLGESLASVFMENVNRPYTGTIAYGEEVGIFLFEDVVINKGTKK